MLQKPLLLIEPPMQEGILPNRIIGPSIQESILQNGIKNLRSLMVISVSENRIQWKYNFDELGGVQCFSVCISVSENIISMIISVGLSLL